MVSIDRRAGPVLVVDDDEDIRETLHDFLAIEGYDVALAEHGGQALAQLASGLRPCLILLDLMMPVMSGLEFLDRLRRQPEHDTTPVVVITAWPDQVIPAGTTQGMVQKPFALADVLGHTRSHCNKT